MVQQAAWDWKKIVLVGVGIGVAMLVALVATAAVGFVWATSAVERLGEPAPESVVRTIATRAAGAEAATAGAVEQPLRVEIELQDGRFEVRPGPPVGGVQVDGAYAKAYYELTEEHTSAAEPGGPATVIRLRPNHSWFVRLVAGALGGHDGLENALTVILPREVPIALTLRLRAGESRTDLGGLNLTDLDVELSMGDHRLDFSGPLAGRPHRVRVDGGMGEIRIERVGNAGPRELEVSGRMGDVSVDLGGAWPRDAVADVTLSSTMAELSVDVPDAVRIASDSDVSNLLGEVGGIRTGDDADGAGPLVRLHLTNTMGETRVRRH